MENLRTDLLGNYELQLLSGTDDKVPYTGKLTGLHGYIAVYLFNLASLNKNLSRQTFDEVTTMFIEDLSIANLELKHEYVKEIAKNLLHDKSLKNASQKEQNVLSLPKYMGEPFLFYYIYKMRYDLDNLDSYLYDIANAWDLPSEGLSGFGDWLKRAFRGRGDADGNGIRDYSERSGAGKFLSNFGIGSGRYREETRTANNERGHTRSGNFLRSIFGNEETRNRTRAENYLHKERRAGRDPLAPKPTIPNGRPAWEATRPGNVLPTPERGGGTTPPGLWQPLARQPPGSTTPGTVDLDNSGTPNTTNPPGGGGTPAGGFDPNKIFDFLKGGAEAYKDISDVVDRVRDQVAPPPPPPPGVPPPPPGDVNDSKREDEERRRREVDRLNELLRRVNNGTISPPDYAALLQALGLSNNASRDQVSDALRNRINNVRDGGSSSGGFKIPPVAIYGGLGVAAIVAGMYFFGKKGRSEPAKLSGVPKKKNKPKPLGMMEFVA